jgi:hypothetical protein
MKKLPKSIENRINEINQLIPLVDKLGDFAYTYAGGTWPYKVDIKPIEINKLKVIIKAKNPVNVNSNDFLVNEIYNTNDFYNMDALKYDLSVILKAFKKALK